MLSVPFDVLRIMPEPYFEVLGAPLGRWFLAGGAVRDYILGLPPNDFDVWAYCMPGEIIERASLTAELDIRPRNSYGAGPYIVFKINGLPPVQVMLAHRRIARDIVAEFDFTINRVWVDDRGLHMMEPQDFFPPRVDWSPGPGQTSHPKAERVERFVREFPCVCEVEPPEDGIRCCCPCSTVKEARRRRSRG